MIRDVALGPNGQRRVADPRRRHGLAPMIATVEYRMRLSTVGLVCVDVQRIPDGEWSEVYGPVPPELARAWMQANVVRVKAIAIRLNRKRHQPPDDMNPGMAC